MWEKMFLTALPYTSLIMLYYHQILDSIYLSTCFLSIRILYFSLELIDLMPH